MDALSALAGGIPAPTNTTPRKTLSERLSPMIEGLAKSDPKAAEALRERLDRSSKTAQSMDEALEAARKQKQEFAKQRVEQLREQFGVLHLFAAADPKSAARYAAQMGKDLKSAVQDYEDSALGGTNQASINPTAIGEGQTGAEIRDRLRAQLDQISAKASGNPEDKKFASDAFLVRGLIQGLADFAGSALKRSDVRNQRSVSQANQNLSAVDQALDRLLHGQSRTSVNVIV